MAYLRQNQVVCSSARHSIAPYCHANVACRPSVSL